MKNLDLFKNYEKRRVVLYENEYDLEDINDSLTYFLDKIQKNKKGLGNINIIGIGTDLLLGDSLGPLCGSLLSLKIYDKLRDYTGYVNLYGFMGDNKENVNANNCNEVITNILNNKKENDIDIVIDACLTDKLYENKSIVIDLDPIEPASGLGKKKIPIGDISIKYNLGISRIENFDRDLAKITPREIFIIATKITDCLLDCLLIHFNKYGGIFK